MIFHAPTRLIAALLLLLFLGSCATEKDHLVTIQTKFGNMKVILYDATPKHKANFLKLAENGSYDSTTFHRIIKNFMVQGGDINAKKAEESPINYTIEAEFVDSLIHEKGALAAARLGDQENPKKESSGDQFYIVDGQTFTESELKNIVEGQYMNELQRRFGLLIRKPEYKPVLDDVIAMQKEGDMNGIMQKINDFESVLIEQYGPLKQKKLSQKQIDTYTKVGGSPHLDGDYTVFGKVIDGLAIIDSIAAVRTGAGDKPYEDIFMTMKVEEMSKKKITDLYGYHYPEN